MTQPPALLEAIREAGGLSRLARKLGVTKQAIFQWRVVPPRHVRTIERVTGVPCGRLRPDVFGEATSNMKIDKNYQQASLQLGNAVSASVQALCTATTLMIAGRPGEAAATLNAAKIHVEGALTAAKWATTLPAPEDK